VCGCETLAVASRGFRAPLNVIVTKPRFGSSGLTKSLGGLSFKAMKGREYMRFLSMMLALFIMVLPLQAQQDEIRSVISGQIQSLLKDDFDTAFSYAAPNIKQMFQTPERFGQMVANGYPMVHRPAEITFQDLVETDGEYTQDVLLRDVQGLYYVARYTLVMVGDSWQISGVNILESAGVGV
jgi:hypothetical protein